MIITNATNKKKKKNTSTDENNSTWVKNTEDVQKIKETWQDGYQAGDVTKTILGATNIAKNTTLDVFTNISKGFLNTVEGTVDAGRYLLGSATKKSAEIQANIWDALGNESYANSLRKSGQDVYDFEKKNAMYDVTANILGEQNDIFKENWSKKINEKSVLGEKSGNVAQGIGNVGAFVGLGYLSGGSNAATFINSFSSAYGNTRNEAYKKGVDDKTANRAAWISGLSEGISEQFFSGLPGLASAGWGDVLNSRLSNSIAKYFGSKTGKLALTFFDGLGEGTEEILSNIFNAFGTDIMHYIDNNYTYGMENMSGNVAKDTLDAAFSQDSMDSFISAMLTSVLTGGGKQLTQNITTNKASNKIASQNNMSKQQAYELLEQIAEKRANLELDENANYKEKTEAIDNQKQILAKEIKQAVKEGQKIDLNELFNQTPNSKQEVQFSLDQDEFKNVKSDKQKVLANDMARLNNVKENHDLFKVVNAIQSANNTQQYHITTTEGLYEMGIVNKDANGNYTMPDGSPYVPRGLNYKNGEIYINADVGSQSGTQAVYHEMFEGFKKAAPEQYNQFKQMVTDIIGEENIQKEFDTYKSMYGEELTDDIRDEIINDKFGELAESQDFINKIADNRNVLEKFIDSIKNMIKYVKGTDEERQLMKLQKNLEKQFAKRYKATDFSGNKGETAYSLKESKAMLEKQFKDLTGDSLLVAEAKLGNYAFQQIRGNQVEAPYNQEAMDLLEKIQNSKKTSSHLYHSTPADRIQSIVKNGLVVGSKQNQEGVSSTNKLYLSSTEELADSFTPENSVMLRISPNAQLENLDNDLLGGEGSYTITNNIDPKYLQVKENGKWIPLLKSKYANQTKYSLATNKDSEGRTLTPQQQEYFKDTKMVDKNGNLEVMYHSGKSGNYNVIDFNRTGENTGYDNTAFGYFITNSKAFSERFKDIDNEGNKGYTREFYANIKKPIIHPYQAWLKYEGEELDNIIKNYYQETDNLDALKSLEEQVKLNNDGSTIADIYAYLSTYEESPFEDALKEKEILQQKGYDAVEFIEGEESYIAPNSKNNDIVSSYAVFDSNQIKLTDNTNPTSNEDIRYSLTTNKDSQGRELSKQQQEYFKDSKVVDENGNLKVVYRGSSTEKSYNVFDTDRAGSNGIWFGKGFYFAGELDHALTYAKNNDTSNIYEVYLNLTNPYIMDSDTTNPDGTIEFAPSFYEQIENKFGDYLPTDWKELNSYQKGRAAQNALMDNGYDGVIAGDTYVAYNSNQIKNVDNTNPTSNEDIRYSLTSNKDSNGRTLSEGQQNFFKNSKVVDEDGNLIPVFRAGYEQGTDNVKGFFTNDKNAANYYKNYFERDKWGGEGQIYEVYMNLENPLVVDAEGNWYQEVPFEGEELWTDDIVDIAKERGYDGVIFKNVAEGDDWGGFVIDDYVSFNPNQVKNVDNLNPTENDDIRLSLTSNENIDSKEIAPVGSTVEETIAPIREDLSNITEQMNNLSNQLETMQESLENAPKGYVETYKQQRNENIPTKQLTEEDANTLQDALMNDEGYLRSLDEEANLNPENTKLIDKLTNDVSGRLDLNKNQKDTLRNIIKESIENGYSTNEISDALYHEFSKTSNEVTNYEAIEVRKLLRDTPIKVSDAIKKDISDYGRWKQSNFGKIRFSNMGSPVDTAYAELSDMMPYYFPSDIVNPTDQLLRIAEVANMATKSTETMNIEPEYFDDIADYIKNTQLEDEYNAKMKGQYDIDKDIQFNMIEDIAPTTIRTQESIDDFIENRDIAPVREDVTNKKSKSPISERLDTMKRRFGEMITNRNYEIDKTSKATGNRDIKFAGDMLNNVSGEVQYNINNKQTDMNGNVIGKSVSEIFAPSKKAGLYEVFNDYLYNKSNIERHRVGKGSKVPEAVSEQLVKQYEQQYPELQEWANDVYNYYDNVLQEQVDAGLITQKQYDNYRGEHGIYRSYTPFYEESTDTSRYFDSEGKVKPVSTLKRSKGNADDVNQLLSMEDAMAKQTYAYKRAIRQNELYKEIVSSMEKFSDAMDMDVRDEPNNLNDSLYVTPEGNKVLSAYINGEKTSALISDELFNELSGENEARIKQLEKDFSLVTTPLQKVSSARRNILTSWNPTFLARNAIKDIQDAVINSKHTGDMLKNYFGAKKGQKSAVFELREGKTKEAQQFLALYGADNLYGDYSNVGQKKGLINKFARANELIELAPRFAEFKASLQNGESVQEAIYNAREVTTNFGRGGYITKALNNNGFTFLNANVQGLDKLVRNLSGENGVKGVTSVVVKGAAFAVLPSILNELLYGFGDDKDEDYEALPNYIKDNYYLIKTVNGNFVRIPKGRINAAFGSVARRTINALEGDENPYEGALSNAWDQIGVGDLGGNNILAPINQAFGSKNGEAWYGGDIVPTRLQDKPASEQTDAKIDAISNFIGKNLGVSPYKVNYVLDQYSGGFGDVLLPMITPETKSGAEKPHEYLLAPIKDAFVVNSTDDNKYAGEFYNTKDKLEIQYNSENATDEDILKYKYMSNISKQMSDLYKERREVQADTTIGNKEKYAKVQVIQNEINNLAKEALSNYNNFSNTENYTNIDDVEYYKNSEGEWTKIKDEESEFTAGLNDAEKTAYYNVKNKISGITKDYTAKTKDLDKDDPKKAQYSTERKENITQAIVNSGLDNYTKAMVYSKYYSDKDAMTNAVNSGYNIDTYITALNDIGQLRDEYSKDNGYSTEERKQRTIAYINSLEMNIPQKAMMIRQYYSSFRDYNNDIVDYVSNLNISYEDKKAILEGTGMTVNGNNVSWK